MDDLRERYLSGDDEKFDPETGEIAPSEVVIDATVQAQTVYQSPMIAANGDRLPQIAATAGNFIDMLEDGQFSADIHSQINETGLTVLMGSDEDS